MNDWVFLRGLARESRHWGDFPDVFAARMPDVRVVAIDLPGNGKHNDRRSPLAVEAVAAWCRDEARRLGVTLPCHVLAMSLGGMVAVSWATSYPQEVAGAVLINTSLRPLNPVFQRMRPGGLLALLRAAAGGIGGTAREARLLRLTSARGDPAGPLPRQWSEYARDRPVKPGNALRQLLAAARFRAPATSPAVPLLVLAGARDALVHPECSRRLAARWNCAFAEHPQAGHDLALDDGAWVADQVARWIAGQRRRGTAGRHP